MDFTLKTYQRLLHSLQQQGFSFQPFEDFLQNPGNKTIILRHDVDLKPQNSLLTAQLEHELGIKGSYYFRILPESYNEDIIKQIADLGHEIGYHYEDLTLAKGNIDKAYESFCHNLETFRKIYPVKTICMHGSPLSKWDSRKIWEKYNYKEMGIIGEPYFDIDFSQVLYLTDTGRRWDGEKVSVRDKDSFQSSVLSSQSTPLSSKYHFHSTSDIIKAAEKNQLPGKIMITFHPQRWTNKPLPWVKELVWQNVKNVVKRVVVMKVIK